MDFSASKDACKPITGATGTGPLQPWPEYIQIPKEHGPHIMWDSQVAEHFKNGRRHVALYPLLKSLQVRLEKVRKLGIHLGAGPELDHFYNVLLE
ncbi:hypothetical protein Celaphus_00018725 [Cervus elaphus hippelaphus]|uniref:Uncharacterized protein n=1 Tax=Cervus elaphus hippelaphus TaxID=46360 RepID=A0A212C654_CEREH|nr:hypothetical protein Celaphus_00018725 [Cervus elaphus hippelaphus]